MSAGREAWATVRCDRTSVWPELHQHFEQEGRTFDLRLAFEDDRRNVDMFHAEGVPCVYIHSGYYDGGGLTQPMGTK